MESWLRSNIYPGKRNQWEMIWRREEEKLSLSIFHPHLLLSLDNSANFSSFHFLPARSLFVSEPLQSCLFSPRTYLICIHLLPDQTCHTTTNYLIWAVPLHRSILFPSITAPWFLAVFISFPFFSLHRLLCITRFWLIWWHLHASSNKLRSCVTFQCRSSEIITQ